VEWSSTHPNRGHSTVLVLYLADYLLAFVEVQDLQYGVELVATSKLEEEEEFLLIHAPDELERALVLVEHADGYISSRKACMDCRG
jgi:hypothetical protein